VLLKQKSKCVPTIVGLGPAQLLSVQTKDLVVQLLLSPALLVRVVLATEAEPEALLVPTVHGIQVVVRIRLVVEPVLNVGVRPLVNTITALVTLLPDVTVPRHVPDVSKVGVTILTV
jgi:hypothetical protein